MPKPTETELEILSTLWELGPSTVGELHEALGRSKRLRYTTTLRQLQLMAEKGLVSRDESQRAHVYRAALKQERVLQQVTGNLLRRAFGGSAMKLVMHALRAGKVPAEDLDAIRAAIDEYEERNR
jgi:predicted transcriptional regulator